ncbi:MAG: IS3 family transposase [Candidatus Obscuribacterales bacterium]|nr:IS3 family transposase [Candidatus Obscuribacterales bacterium]
MDIRLLAERIGNARMICRALKLPRATYYRLLKPPATGGVHSIRTSRSHRALSKEEIEQVIDVLHEARFMDKTPAQIYASLLDEGRYFCSIRTMYRILHSLDEVQERRRVRRHPEYTRPELLATAPNQVWSWDITKLRGPTKWTCFYLYVIIDIYSRHVVGWTLAPRESAETARDLFATTCRRQNVAGSDLVVHSDNGKAMTSKTLAMLFADLGITKSLNRPHVSNDNPFSESQFKTLKYQPTYPERFGSTEHAKSFCSAFFDWYNNVHYHSGIALMTPSTVHYGKAKQCNQRRQAVLDKAFKSNPERFVHGAPNTLELPPAAWINPPDGHFELKLTEPGVKVAVSA